MSLEGHRVHIFFNRIASETSWYLRSWTYIGLEPIYIDQLSYSDLRVCVYNNFLSVISANEMPGFFFFFWFFDNEMPGLNSL